MVTKQDIIKAIQKTAKSNGGQPLGKSRFAEKTGIKPYDWKKFWARFGDAQKEAGFAPNTLQQSYDDKLIIEKMIGLIRKLGRFPMYDDLRIERNSDPEYPHSSTFFVTRVEKRKLAEKISKWCTENEDYQDIVELCAPVLEGAINETGSGDDSPVSVYEVYMFKSGRYYKIGKTNDTVRRGMR